MKFSTKTRYGVRAILEIALSDSETGIYQKDISAHQNISYKYLDHIINSLKVANLVTKAGGRRSGYVLTREPDEITVYDIHNAFEPGICVVDCVSHNFTCKREGICASHGFWGELNNQIITYLKSTTIADLMNDQAKLDDIVN
ncbi:Rrf2 family transcriptional regulator [Draconibacterium sp. IB214405]|uniref:RrF2 family transcriptional regulator n=1 Tax=Draconibacterium sp. IB214405 TaxID=3097352 RepID=UPI002A0BC410|nr:Rrf2 family transcriptional regulator [Draconibacterium sp. IB214405]MDX8337623.1 Rrf2 family transcriptional regulator [Draconibacterium sp. IB214405]